jgi:hypothetical protein
MEIHNNYQKYFEFVSNEHWKGTSRLRLTYDSSYPNDGIRIELLMPSEQFAEYYVTLKGEEWREFQEAVRQIGLERMRTKEPISNLDAIVKYIRQVEKSAEKEMLTPPHKLEGQHYAAMKRVAREIGIDLWER